MNLLSPAAALASAATLGVADFSGGVAGRRSSPPSVALGVEAIGLVALPVAALILPLHWDLASAGYTFAGGLIGGFGLILFYRAMAQNLIGIVAPITGVIAAALPTAVGVLVAADRLHPGQLVGIVAGLAAIALINGPSRAPREGGRRAIGLAVVAGATFGLFFILYHAGSAAGAPAFFAGRAGSAITSIGFGLITRTSLVPNRSSLPLIAVAAPLDGVGVVLYMFASVHGLLSLSALLTSFYPAFTVVCARVFLKERLSTVQAAGATLAVVAIALIAAA